MFTLRLACQRAHKPTQKPTQKRTLHHALASAFAAGSALIAALPAYADPVSWAAWSAVTTGATTGAATATFAAAGVTATYSGELEQFFAGYPSYTPGGTFSGGSVGNAPPAANGIIQIYGGQGTGTNTITFSQAVLNPVIAIWSLGQGGNIAQFNFDHAFTIESGGASAEYGGAAIYSVGNVAFGQEGNGTVRFSGSVNSISWTNPVAENWYGFTVGASVNAVPELETYALMLGGLAALALVARRRQGA